MRQILHIDMDAFFASVEQRDDPRLRGKPVLVGGGERRGVVAAASYEARPFGARSAMPMAQALRLVPGAVIVPPRRRRYEEVSAQVFAIFRRFTPLVEGLSLDEAFLDVTASRGLFGDGETVARQIRAAIRDETGLTASAGVAPSKFVAKIASDLRKPDALTVVAEGEVEGFLAELPLERMWGVGPKAAGRLRAMGLSAIGDLARADEERLERVLGRWGAEVRRLARGIDPREVVPHREAKSVGAEQTYGEDLRERGAIERTLLRHSERVAERLHAAGLSAGTVTVKLKFADFRLETRRAQLDSPADDASSIYEAARGLLDRFELGSPPQARAVRLTGVAASDLREGPPVPTLFDAEQKARRRAIQSVTADLKARFGARGSITRADSLLAPGGDDEG